MKILIDIPDNKAASLLEVLESMSNVKVKTLTEPKAVLMEEIKEAVDNLILVKQGKMKAKPARKLLDEL